MRNGSALKVAAIQGRAGLLESQQAVLTADLQLADLTTELNDLLGLPLDTRLDLDPAVPANFEHAPTRGVRPDRMVGEPGNTGRRRSRPERHGRV